MPNIKKMLEKKDIFGLDRVVRTCTDSAARRSALKALGSISDPRSVAPILYALTDTDETVRQMASKALDNCGPEAVPNLCMSFSSPYADIRPKLAAIGALERLWEYGGLVQLEFLAQSCGRTKDEDLFLAVVNSLKRIDHPGTAKNIIGPPEQFKKLKREEAETRLRAVALLGDARATDPLAALLDALSQSPLCICVLETLGGIGGEEAKEAVARFAAEAKDLPEDVQRALDEAVKQLGIT